MNISKRYDRGTGSARAALVSSTGEIIAESTYATTTWRDHDNHDIYEQSTQNSASSPLLGVGKASLILFDFLAQSGHVSLRLLEMYYAIQRFHRRKSKE